MGKNRKILDSVFFAVLVAFGTGAGSGSMSSNSSAIIPAQIFSDASSGVLDLLCDLPAPFRSCNDVAYTPPTGCTLSNSGALRQFIRANVDAFYQGKILNPSGGASGSSPVNGCNAVDTTVLSDPSAYFAGFKIESPICNLKNNVYAPSGGGSPQGEQSQNHLSASCGSVCKFSCKLDHPIVPLVNFRIGGSNALSTNSRDATCRISSGSCSAETSWVRGAFIQLVWDKTDEVINELLTSHKLTVSGRCRAPLQNLTDSLTKFQTSMTKWNKFWSSAGGTPPACQTSGTGTAIVACSMDSTRSALENYPFQVAACEVFARAEMEWVKQPQKARYNRVVVNTLYHAYDVCTTSSSGDQNPPDPQSTDVAKCINDTYTNAIKQEMNKPTYPAPASSPKVTVKPTTSPIKCASGSSVGGAWDPLLCSQTPPTPFSPVELGSMLVVGDALDSAGVNSVNSLQYLTKEPVPGN